MKKLILTLLIGGLIMTGAFANPSTPSTGSTTTITQAELKKILGKGNVTAVFSVME